MTKLAEALIQRRDLQNKLQELKNSMLASALVEEGDVPDISVSELLVQYQQVADQLSDLVVRINRRNQEIQVAGEALQAVLERREALRRRHDLYNSIIEAARDNRRYGRNEIRMVRTVNLRELTDQLDRIAKEIREVDGLIQQTNWLEDL